MEISVLADSELSGIERSEIDQVCDEAFSANPGENNPSFDLQWVPENDWHVVVRVDGIIVSHVGIVERTGTVDGHPVDLGGIGAVATLPGMQKRGLAAAAMLMASGFMQDSLKVDFGFLVCSQETARFYRKLGWQEVAGPVIFDQPQGKITFREVAMILVCVKKEWPTGIIDLCGLPW